MAQALFVWLGTGRAQKRGVGEEGSLLDRVARAGLPVPRGGILLDDFYKLALEDGLLVAANGRLTCPDPDLLHQALYEVVRFPKLDKVVVVWPLFGVEEGCFSPQHNVQFTDPGELSRSLCEVYSAAVSQPDGVRRDVLVMEMVAVVVTGTAVTGINQPTDAITTKEQSLILPQLGLFQAASQGVPPFAQRLQKLLRGVRRTFGAGNWRIKWGDDGEICWLLSISVAI